MSTAAGRRRVLMLVATSVATDTRVLREATALVADGWDVHVIGRSVPTDWDPPAGVTVSSVGTSSVFRREEAPAPAARGRRSPLARLARWVLLPQHRNSAYTRWAQGAEQDAAGRRADVVHAHDFTALEVGDRLARAWGVPLVYDTHELWAGRPREYRPTPLQDRRERRVEAELGRRAAAVVTVGEGVAQALRRAYGWTHVTVVQNTFPERADLPAPLDTPTALVYAGRLAAYRELEVAAAASTSVPLPVVAVGPSDPEWLARFEPGAVQILPSETLAEVDHRLTAAGASLVAHSDQWENHRLAMPNKLFHAVSLGVPVVATDVGELARVVREHDLGTLYTPGDAASLAEATTRLVRDYPTHVTAVRAARSALSWEHDAATLRGLYADLAS